MGAKIVVTLAGLLLATSGCSFMGDVMHAEGDYAHKIGNAFKRQGARHQAAKAQAAKKQQKSAADLAEK